MSAATHLMNTYGRLPIALSHGQGCRVWDTEGKRVPRRAGRHRRQHAGPQPPQAGAGAAGPGRQADPQLQLLPRAAARSKLAAKLVRAVGADQRVLLLHRPGSQRGAIKLARKFGHDQGIERPEIVVYEKAFHGRSIATLSATGNEKVQKGFGPLVEGFIRVPLNDIEALQRRGARATRTWWPCSSRPSRAKAASTRARIEYLQQLRKLCDAARLAADDRRSAVRHGPHRQVVRAPVGRHQARRDAAGQGPGLGRAGRRDRRRPEAAKTCSGRATTAPPSAATRWRCAPASRPCASWKKTACWTTPRAVGERIKAALAARAGRPERASSRSAARA